MIHRRAILKGAVALGAAGLTGQRTARAAARLPAREEFVVRNAYVMTMDAALGDIANGDVHVRNGEIVAAGVGLKAPGARAIDWRGCIVLPGLIDTHWHMWNTLLRSLAGDKAETGYFAMSPGVGQHFTPADMYQGARLAATEAIASGITYVHDWCHNTRSPEHVEADLRALAESGVRGRFSYGTAQAQSANQTLNLADLERLHREWNKFSNDGLLSLGVAWRGMAGSEEVYRKEFETARKLQIPVSTHVSAQKGGEGAIERMAKAGMAGKDVLMIHAIWVSPADIQALAKTGSPISLSPFTELRTGFGFPKTGAFLVAGVTVSLSVDTTGLSGNADMFGIMKLIQNVENAQALSEFKLPPRKVIELATMGGAKAMGVDASVGSLKPGKRADLIMVNTRDVNLGVFSDPAHMIVEAAQPSNVDTVVVDGRILKRRGKLTAVDPQQVTSESAAAFAAVRKRANWP